MDIQLYINTCEKILPIYDIMFIIPAVSSILKTDLLWAINCIRENSAGHKTLEDIVNYEIKNYKIENIRLLKDCGTKGILWSKRTIEFIHNYLITLMENPSISSGKCARDTYTLVLSRYHGWLTSMTAKMIMSGVPERQEILNKLPVKEIIEELSPIITSINNILLQYNVDFPDKI